MSVFLFFIFRKTVRFFRRFFLDSVFLNRSVFPVYLNSERSFVHSSERSSVFLFLGFSAIIPDRDLRSVFRFSITFHSFIGIRRSST